MTDYGVYNYADGAIYRGEWLHNKHHGHGQYQFANGTLYEGEWSQHQMHGTGMFIDHNGKVWKGEYRQGKFDCRRQKELIKEKAIVLQKIAIKKEV